MTYLSLRKCDAAKLLVTAVTGNLSAAGNGTRQIAGIASEIWNGAIYNCVALCGKLSASDNDRDARIRRVFYYANNSTTDYNYGSWEMQGDTWGDVSLSGKDGAHCEMRPDPYWWTNPDTWKTTDGASAWDFEHIWEIVPDGFPRLRKR